MTTIRSSRSKALNKRDQKRVHLLGEHWHLDEKHKKLTGTFAFDSYLEAFMFVTKVSVHAQVRSCFPEIMLTSNRVKVILVAPTTITSEDIDFATTISHLYLSTPSSTQRFTKTVY